MLREMQREVNTGHSFERRLHIDYSAKNHPPQLHAATDLDCCSMAILSGGKPAGPRIMRKLWSNLNSNHAMNFRGTMNQICASEQTIQGGKRTDDISKIFRASEEWKLS